MFSLPFNYRDNIDLIGVPTFLTDINRGSFVSVEWTFNSDGTGIAYAGLGGFTGFEWIYPTYTSFADNYEISGDSGGTWSPLSSGATFGASLSPNSGDATNGFNFVIRRIGSTLILATLSVSYYLDSGA